MEKKRWSLIFFALCLALAFSVGSVEAKPDACVDGDGDGWFKNTGKCRREEPPMPLDCDDGNPLVIGPPPCDDPDDPTPPPDPPPGIPIIAVVANKFPVGSATGYITSQLLTGIYANVRVSTFNRQNAQWLRDRFDVLHIPWSSPSSMQVSRSKLEAFMVLGGSILHEDPQNVLEIGLDGVSVEHHVPGDDFAIVEFATGTTAAPPYDEPEEILSAFGISPSPGSYFLPGMNEVFCLSINPSPEPIQTLGLGYGCLVNNHMTFANTQSVLGLKPFLYLAGAAVGLYGEFPVDTPTGRILFTGPDSALHASFVASPLQANHFCLLTNELVWLSHLDPTIDPALDAIDNCVMHASDYLTQSLE